MQVILLSTRLECNSILFPLIITTKQTSQMKSQIISRCTMHVTTMTNIIIIIITKDLHALKMKSQSMSVAQTIQKERKIQ